MTKKWVIQYFDGTQWVDVPNTIFKATNEELNGHEEANFLLPNTEANRIFVLNDYQIKFFYDSIFVFGGVMKAVSYSNTTLAITVYNQVYELLQKRVVSGAFNFVPANVVLNTIMQSGGNVQTFGNSVIESGLELLSFGTMHSMGPFMTPDGVSLSLTQIFAALKIATVQPVKAKVAVYSCDYANPSEPIPVNLIGVSDEIIVSSTDITWNIFPFSTPLTLDPSKYYQFVLMADFYLMYAVNWSITHQWTLHRSNGAYTNGFPDPFPTSFNMVHGKPSVYGVVVIS